MKKAIGRFIRHVVSIFFIQHIFVSLVCGQVITNELTEDEKGSVKQSFDSLVGQWHLSGCEQSEMVPDTIPMDSLSMMTSLPDSVYIKRLAEIVSPIPFSFNPNVKKFIEFYSIRRRDLVERMLGSSEYYFPMFEAELDANNLPLELKYLPIIESALNPHARSRVGASGLWQFMYGTGKMYGLEINSYVDERLDPNKATAAAVRYLKDLYAIYGDWHLVLAAYNCGPGNVNKAIKRSGGVNDFWKIYYNLPRETRDYVPAFIAAAYVMNYYRDHNLLPRPTILPQTSDTIIVDKPLHFEQIASVLSCSVDLLRELNPQYRNNLIPAIKKPYTLCLPFDYSMAFVSLEDSIYNINKDKYFSSNKALAAPVSGDFAPDVPYNSSKVYHTVRSGETPGHIADKYHISLSNLRNWNHLNSRLLIRAGQRLVVYVPKGKEPVVEKKSVTVDTNKEAKVSDSVIENPNAEYIYYTVQKGDNLWTIAKQFPGVSGEDIKSLNNITDSRRIAIGQRLRIKPKS